MGNSCTREEAVALSETGIRPLRRSRNMEAAMQGRGRWSAIGFDGSVDLDALLEAPSPAVLARRRKRGTSQSERIQRTLSRESAGSAARGSSDRAPPSSGSSKAKSKRAPGSWFRSAKSTSALDDPPTRDEEEESTYHSYDDPGYLSTDTDRDLELTTMDSDLILASPSESLSPTVIHARWGEPVDDPDEEGVCTDFKPNPFKLGFCINCQKQHDVNANGDVESKKEYKKITRPTIAKYAANALDNPAAVLNITPRSHEADDVDLGELLQQRRDILAKLGQLQKEKQPECDCDEDADMKHPDYAARHTMFLADTNGTNLANLRRMAAAGGPQGPQSLRVQRAASARSDRAPASFCGVTKSLSLGNAMLREDSEEPVCNDWL